MFWVPKKTKTKVISSIVSSSSIFQLFKLSLIITSQAVSISPLYLYFFTIFKMVSLSKNSQTPSDATIMNLSSLFSVYSRISMDSQLKI